MAGDELPQASTEPVGAVQVIATEGLTRVVLTGEIDAAVGDELDHAAQAVRELQLPAMVDATAVTFMDSTGVRLIARCYAHGPVTVTASPPVQLLLKVLAMDHLIAPARSAATRGQLGG